MSRLGFRSAWEKCCKWAALEESVDSLEEGGREERGREERHLIICANVSKALHNPLWLYEFIMLKK